jgi:hypothetical protein
MSTARSIAPISPVDLAQLEDHYTFRDRPTVLRFLRKHPFLVPLLREGADQVQRYFPDTPLLLEFYRDAEESGLNHLVVHIVTDRSLDQALEQLDRFGEDWWLNVITEAQMKLDFDVELR